MSTTSIQISLPRKIIAMDDKAPLTLCEKYPEVYRASEVPQVTWQTRKRTVPMRVLALGMPRTATASLWTALRQLGFNETHHMLSLFANPTDCPRWTEAARRKILGLPPFTRDEWDALLGDCQAVCDLPSIAFVPELLATYPDALVILNTRPVAGWYASCLSTIHMVESSPLTMLFSYTDPTFFGRFRPMAKALWEIMFEGDFVKNGARKYEEHYQMVRDLVPKERLLEFEPAMGWGPLCEFLGVDVPQGRAYPRVNDKDSFGERFRLMLWRATVRSVKNVVGVGCGMGAMGWLGWKAWEAGRGV